MAPRRYRYPFPPFPIGWFLIAYSDELAVGQVKPIKAMGQDLVLFRGEDGVARVFNAWCPHLGAHLGHGGTVVGNGLVCPFHRWGFDESGQCVSIPYSKRPIPQQAQLRRWTVQEINQSICIWYDPSAPDTPAWELPVMPQVGTREWTRFRSVDRVAKFHCQEIRENGVDPIHFDTVHGLPPNTFEVTTEGPILRQTSKLTAQLGSTESETAHLTIDYYGLGYAVAQQRIGELEFLVLSHATPIDEDSTQLRFAMSIRRIPSLRSVFALSAHLREAGGKQGTWGMAKRMLTGLNMRELPAHLAHALQDTVRGVAASQGQGVLEELLTQMIAIPTVIDFGRQLDQDIYLTENKTYFEKPIYRDGEHTIHAMRKWAQQFYPAPSA